MYLVDQNVTSGVFQCLESAADIRCAIERVAAIKGWHPISVQFGLEAQGSVTYGKDYILADLDHKASDDIMLDDENELIVCDDCCCLETRGHHCDSIHPVGCGSYVGWEPEDDI